jgi:hypothetical protein
MKISTDKKLTTTEVRIIIAEIEDRMMRVARAQDELSRIPGNNDWDEFVASLRVKYNIPEGVHLFSGEGEFSENNGDVKCCRSYLNAFVRGRLTKEIMDHLYYYFEEHSECDYGWILIEKPMGFYDQPSEYDMNEIIDEIKFIGTRSPLKNNKLKPIFDFDD